MLAYENIGIALLIYFFTRLSYSAITSEFVVMWGQDALAFNSEKHEERKTKTLINSQIAKLVQSYTTKFEWYGRILEKGAMRQL